MNPEPFKPFSKSVAGLIGFVTVLPILYIFFFFSFILRTVFRAAPSTEFFPILMAAHVGVMVLTFALLAFYLWCLFQTDEVRNDLKAVWAIILFFGGAFGMAVFWYLYLWKPISRDGLGRK